MSDSPLATLLHPFERGLLKPPAAGDRVLFLGAPAELRLPDDFGGEVFAVQGFRPDYLALERAGFAVFPEPEGTDYDMALALLGRHRRENEMHLGEALRRTRDSGLIVAACAKKDGAASMRKRVEALVPLTDHASKHHGVVFWFRRPEYLANTVLAAFPQDGVGEADGFVTVAGGFSDDGVDSGSALLAASLPDDLSGRVADFAAGWGYLSTRVAERFSAVSGIDLYEAHHASLEAAKRNMATHAPGVATRFFWRDLLGEPVTERYDTIVMNPPFHRGRAAEPDMGRGMIVAASGALKPRGRLFLVANRPLPYEDVLAAHFAAHGEICRDGAFKVLWGRKR